MDARQGQPARASSGQVYAHVVADLPAGETVQLQRDSRTLVNVVVDDRRDDEAPAVPEIDVGPYSGGRCPPYVALDVASSDDAVLFIGRVGRDPDLTDGVRLDGLSNVSPLVVTGADGAREDVHVVAVDVAGNLGAAAVAEVEFPDTRTSCQGGCPGAPIAPGLLLPLLRRRRRRSG